MRYMTQEKNMGDSMQHENDQSRTKSTGYSQIRFMNGEYGRVRADYGL